MIISPVLSSANALFLSACIFVSSTDATAPETFLETPKSVVIAQLDNGDAEKDAETEAVLKSDESAEPETISTIDASKSFEAPVGEESPTEMLESVDSPLVFEGETDSAVVDKIVAYLENLSTVSADFVQSSPSGAITSGRLWLRRPRQLRMEYAPVDKPPLVVIATQGNVYVQDNELETTDLYPIKRTPLKYLLAKKIKTEELEVTAVHRGEDLVSLSLKDPDDEDVGEITLVFDAPALAFRQWLVRDPQRGLTVVSLENLESGVKIANNLFRVPEAGGSFINN